MLTPQELRQLAKSKSDEARALIEKYEDEKRASTEDEDKAIKALQIEARGYVDKAIILEGQNDLDASLRSNTPDDQGKDSDPNIEVNGKRAEVNIGTILRALTGNQEARSAMQMDVGTKGGFIVPEAVADKILAIPANEAIVRPRADIIPTDPASPDQKTHIMGFKQGSTGIYGGMTMSWTAETGTKTELNPLYEDILLDPRELEGYVPITNKLLNNAARMSGYIEGLMRAGIAGQTDDAYLIGDGVGKPLGVLNAANAGALKIKRGTASSITFVDIKKMSAALLPQSRMNAVFIVSNSALEGLYNLQDGSGRIVYNPGNIQAGVLPTLWGYPVLVSGALATYGSEGDLALVDFKYYTIQDGFGPQIEMSTHANFTSNQTVFRVIMNTDGQPTVREPLKLQNGTDYASPYVILK